MSQYLPYNGFAWVAEKEWSKIQWLDLKETDDVGYFIECDLEYPIEIHDEHNDYPLAPERMQMKYERLNETHLKILRQYRISKSGLAVSKLVPHFLKRTRYCVHYLNLKFYLEHNIKLLKIHRVIKFNQAPWLKPYIEKNSVLRANAKNDFEKDQFKLYNNSIYGKTVENQKKRTDIRLVTTEKKCKRLTKKPHMMRFKIFSENLAAIELRKTKAVIDKPFYVGFTVLELSKLHMYRFHYDYIRKEFKNKAELLFTDTDSLMYQIFDENVYEKFYADREKFFDLSEYPKENKYFDEKNKRVVGFFKDEAKGLPISEFIGLRPKMYSYLVRKADGANEEKHRAKGIQLAVAKNFRHEDYLKELKKPIENLIKNKRIGTKLHQIYSIETKKRGLCAFDDKRILLEDEIHTLAYGHHRVTGSVEEIEVSEPQFRVGSDNARLSLLIEEEIPDGEPPQSFLARNRWLRGYATIRNEAAVSPAVNLFQSMRNSNPVSTIIDDVLKEKLEDFPHLNKDYYKDELYDFALKLVRKKKSENEIKLELTAMLDELIKPNEFLSSELEIPLESEEDSDNDST